MQSLTLIFHFILLWQRKGNIGIISLSVLVPMLFFGIIILFVVGSIVFSYKRKQKRIQNLQMFAAQNGWQLIPNAGVNFFPNSDYYTLLAEGRNKQVSCLMQRQFGNGTVFLFDYEYTTGSGKSRSVHTLTVFGFHSPQMHLPFFSLYPESFLSFIGEAFGYNDIDFASHPHFSKRYKLSGKDEMSIRQTFHPQMLTNFDQLPTVNIDGGGNYLFIYEPNATVRIENMNWFINERMNFVSLFAR